MLPSTKVRDDLGEAIRTGTMTPTDWALFGELVGRGVRYGKAIELERFSNHEQILITQIEGDLASASNKIGEAFAKNYEQDSTEIREIHSELCVINSLIANTDWELQS